jgi:site-specific recombinase XerD
MLLPEIFKNYLIIRKTSPVTAKNYLVDVNHFLNWLAKETGVKYQIVGKAIFGLFTEETLNEYKTNLLLCQTPLSTLNRRLSALRKFGEFGKEQEWLKENPAEKITNATKTSFTTLSTNKQPNEEILEKFSTHLEKEKASPITIKNYLSDLRHFLGWLEGA